MEVIYHRLIQKDLHVALDYYESEGGPELADRFFDEAEDTVARVLKNPRGFHFQDRDLRRAQFKVFPYHFLFRDLGYAVRFHVLRHDRRHPSYGLRRK